MKVNKLTLALVSILLLTGVSYRATAQVTLESLINSNGTLICGDKTFSKFSYQVSPQNAPNFPAAKDVNVTCTTDSNGNIGILFQAGWANLNVGTTIDALLGFDVDVTDPSNYIYCENLRGNPFVIGPGPGLVSIVETVGDGSKTLGLKEIHYLRDSNGNVDMNLNGQLTFDPAQKHLHILKDMLFRNDGGTPTLSFVEQIFKQVPEPGTNALLAGMALSGGMFLRRRRR